MNTLTNKIFWSNYKKYETCIKKYFEKICRVHFIRIEDQGDMFNNVLIRLKEKEAFDKFDPSYGASMESWLYACMEGYVLTLRNKEFAKNRLCQRGYIQLEDITVSSYDFATETKGKSDEELNLLLENIKNDLDETEMNLVNVMSDLGMYASTAAKYLGINERTGRRLIQGIREKLLKQV